MRISETQFVPSLFCSRLLAQCYYYQLTISTMKLGTYTIDTLTTIEIFVIAQRIGEQRAKVL